VDFELVVSHYNESLRWMNRIPPVFVKTIYHKGAEWIENSIALSNHGREAHSYLFHLVNRYDSLAETTVFCQGHPFDHASDFHQVLRDLDRGVRRVSEFCWLGFIIDTDDVLGQRLFMNWSKNPAKETLDLKTLYEALFEKSAPPLYHFYPGAQFIVSKKLVLLRPREFYIKALELSLEIENAAHGFERIWDQVFGVRGVDPELLAGKSCHYLKPIRRFMNSESTREKKSGQ